MAKRRTAQIERDVALVVRDAVDTNPRTLALYYPGGDGGGGRRSGRGGRTGAVVLPHPRTSHGCRLCTKYHTTAEHYRHTGASRPPPKKTKKTPKKKTRASAERTPARPKTSGTRGTKAKTSLKRPSASPGDQIQIIRDAVHSMPPAGRFGHDKVFISEIWDRIGRGLELSLEEFKRYLITLNRDRVVDLARADATAYMDPNQVRRSEIRDLGSSFHFVVDRSARQPWQ